MSSIIGSSMNSAIMSGQYGLQSASQGITQASQNIASRTVQQNSVENAAPQAAGNLTSDLVSLQTNETSAQASAKVLSTAFDNVGTLIDILA